jgi:hypothetical protein
MKRVILFFALIFPIGLFVFLRYFGKNEFTIPVYFETEAPEIPEGCKTTIPLPYAVSEAALHSLGWKGTSALIVSDTSAVTKRELNQLTQDLNSDNFKIIFINGVDPVVTEICRCELLLNSPWTAVLIDQEKKIRGYYMPNSREEFDRLTVELKILLNQY